MVTAGWVAWSSRSVPARLSSLASERRLPSGVFDQNRIPTRKFNGYGDQVAGLYAGMDLGRNY